MKHKEQSSCELALAFQHHSSAVPAEAHTSCFPWPSHVAAQSKSSQYQVILTCHSTPSQEDTSVPQLRAHGAVTECGSQSKGHRGSKQEEALHRSHGTPVTESTAATGGKHLFVY